MSPKRQHCKSTKSKKLDVNKSKIPEPQEQYCNMLKESLNSLDCDSLDPENYWNKVKETIYKSAHKILD